MSETRGQPIPPPANAAAAPLEKPPLANDSAVASQLSAPATNPATAPGEKVSPIERVKCVAELLEGRMGAEASCCAGDCSRSFMEAGRLLVGRSTLRSTALGTSALRRLVSGVLADAEQDHGEDYRVARYEQGSSGGSCEAGQEENGGGDGQAQGEEACDDGSSGGGRGDVGWIDLSLFVYLSVPFLIAVNPPLLSFFEARKHDKGTKSKKRRGRPHDFAQGLPLLHAASEPPHTLLYSRMSGKCSTAVPHLPYSRQPIRHRSSACPGGSQAGERPHQSQGEPPSPPPPALLPTDVLLPTTDRRRRLPRPHDQG